MHEFVYVGDPDGGDAHRDLWVEAGARRCSQSLGLEIEAVVANDPFFGRLGKMLAANQRDEALKLEFVTPICSTERPTAITSANCHHDHFGLTFGIESADGEVAHSACFGFGVDRDHPGPPAHATASTPTGWPAEVRAPALACEDSQVLRPRPGHLPAAPAARRRAELDRDQLLRRHVDRGAARPRPRSGGRGGLHPQHRLRGRPVDAVQVPARGPAGPLRARGGRDVRVAAGRRPPGRAAGPGPPADRRGRRLVPARHGRDHLPARPREDRASSRRCSTGSSGGSGYFHNAGYFELEGDDFDGIFYLAPRAATRGSCRPTSRS